MIVGGIMASRRKRKRGRRTAETAGRRGGRSRPPQRGMGGTSGLWADASRGELRLLGHASRAAWDVPAERRKPILGEVIQTFEQCRVPEDVRRMIAAFHVLLAASHHNL